jgi:hypothetical protein
VARLIRSWQRSTLHFASKPRVLQVAVAIFLPPGLMGLFGFVLSPQDSASMLSDKETRRVRQSWNDCKTPPKLFYSRVSGVLCIPAEIESVLNDTQDCDLDGPRWGRKARSLSVSKFK